MVLRAGRNSGWGPSSAKLNHVPCHERAIRNQHRISPRAGRRVNRENGPDCRPSFKRVFVIGDV